eukprot:5917853-Pyramimonas_sp.AAC.1
MVVGTCLQLSSRLASALLMLIALPCVPPPLRPVEVPATLPKRSHRPVQLSLKGDAEHAKKL